MGTTFAFIRDAVRDTAIRAFIRDAVLFMCDCVCMHECIAAVRVDVLEVTCEHMVGRG